MWEWIVCILSQSTQIKCNVAKAVCSVGINHALYRTQVLCPTELYTLDLGNSLRLEFFIHDSSPRQWEGRPQCVRRHVVSQTRLFSALWKSIVKLCPTICNPTTAACQAPLSMGFSRQEYRSGLPFPSPGHLPDPGMETACLASPALAGEFSTTEPHKGVSTHGDDIIVVVSNRWTLLYPKGFLKSFLSISPGLLLITLGARYYLYLYF